MSLIALAGNPNVGKSTLFNALTGRNQHTGNWPGKTVELAQGSYCYKGKTYTLVDLPGTYSLDGASPEERMAAEFLQEKQADCVVVVCDATCLQRSLILALQVMQCCAKVLLCVNLIDEARRDGIELDAHRLCSLLGVPVAVTAAGRKEGLARLREDVQLLCEGFSPLAPLRLEGEKEIFIQKAQEISEAVVRSRKPSVPNLTQRLDRVLLHRFWAYPILLLLLLGILWLTIQGANYPSRGLQWCFDRLEQWLRLYLDFLPQWLYRPLLDGVYATLTRVVAVMLPPMAIFFPLFTLLEDFGYLPRVAFLLDERFRTAGACGKQALTTCMGFGCNAVGVTGCRIVDSPRERLIAVVTNALIPCNGRFPTLIFLIGLHAAGASALMGAVGLTLCVVLSVGMSLLAARLLSRTVLRGQSSAFVMELPPYRRPRVMQVLLRSLKDRTFSILARAVAVAAPAGLLLWGLANLQVGGTSLLVHLARLLQTPGTWIGLNGAVLLAFLLGSPANELVLPILVMILTASGGFGNDSTAAMAQTLFAHGWTWQLSLCTLLFTLFHWPCTTTLWTVYRETGSAKWTAISFVLPTLFGIVLCLLCKLLLRLF